MGHLEIESLLSAAVNLRIGSGIAATYGNLNSFKLDDDINDIYVGRTSHALSSSPISKHTHFDLASLTKILATTTLAMKRHEQGLLSLDETLGDLLPKESLLHPSLRGINLRQLLTHTSGVPAWKPFYEEMRNRFGMNLPWVNVQKRKDAFDELLYATAKENETDQKIIYSDLGFLLLENALSSHFQKDVEALWRWMGVGGLHFRPVLTDAKTAQDFIEISGQSIAATEVCPWRGMLVGQVHDDNAWSRGGVGGHAGAFGRLQDIKAWMNSLFLNRFIAASTLREFTREAVSIDGMRRALGFDMPSGDGSGSTGFSFSSSTIGHLGFTGTSIWIDLHSGDYAILLTNRVHPSRDELRIRPLRREFHRLVRALSK